jgi:cysteine desulfurase/selenocysteine lyase
MFLARRHLTTKFEEPLIYLSFYESYMIAFTPENFRQQFPLIQDTLHSNVKTKKPVIYFDNAATTQKPHQVIARQVHFYEQENANVHRSSHTLSNLSTSAYEKSRQLAQMFIGANALEEIIWTKGATESINIVTQSLAKDVLKKGDEIVLSLCEHHANIVPWQIVAKQTGATIKTLPLTYDGYIDIAQLDNIITKKTRFVACAHISNVLGRKNDISSVIQKAKSVGAITLIDGAQAVAHINIDVAALDCDFYVFSAHKMFGPTGVGVLYGKKSLLECMTPYQSGGEMIKHVSFEQETTFNQLPFKFEAGTPNIAGVIAFADCINFIKPLLIEQGSAYKKYEQTLTKYCYEALAKINDVRFVVDGLPDIGVIAFYVVGHHNQDISTSLDTFGIAIRSGHHCAMPLMQTLSIEGCLRVSLSAYNTTQEVDEFIKCLQNILAATNKLVQEINALPIHSHNNEMQMVIDKFAKAKSWDAKHREIMLIGNNLCRLEKSQRNEGCLISGCESSAWLVIASFEQSKYHFVGDSDAKIIRGLLFIVLAIFNNKTSKEIAVVDIHSYFKHLGLLNHLSPSRSNGLLAIVDRIKYLAG